MQTSKRQTENPNRFPVCSKGEDSTFCLGCPLSILPRGGELWKEAPGPLQAGAFDAEDG